MVAEVVSPAFGAVFHEAVFSRAPPHPLVSTTAFCFSISSISVEEIIPVNPHLGTHAISAVNSSGSKIVIVTYKCVEPSSDPAS